jgi:hypothetical protein
MYQKYANYVEMQDRKKQDGRCMARRREADRPSMGEMGNVLA